MPHRIFTNYKCDTECHTGYIKITSVARTLPFLASGVTDINATQDIHKLQVWHRMPHRIHKNYKYGTHSALPSQRRNDRLSKHLHCPTLWQMYVFQRHIGQYETLVARPITQAMSYYSHLPSFTFKTYILISGLAAPHNPFLSRSHRSHD